MIGEIKEKKSGFDLKPLIKFFESKESILFALLFALVTQISHSVIAYAFVDSFILNGGKITADDGSRIDPSIFSYIIGVLFSISISTAILIFTVRKNKLMAYFFVLVEIFINVMYSRLDNNYSFWIFTSILFLSIIIPITIAAYSHQTEKEEAKEEKELNYKELDDYIKTSFENRAEETKNKMIEFEYSVKKLETSISRKVNKNEKLKVEVNTKDKGIVPYEMEIK